MKFLKYVLDTGIGEEGLTPESRSVQKFSKDKEEKRGIHSIEFGIEEIGINNKGNIAIRGTIKNKTLKECRANLVRLKSELKSLFSVKKIEEAIIVTGDILF